MLKSSRPTFCRSISILCLGRNRDWDAPGIELKPEPVKVVGNLPYYITSDILLRLLRLLEIF